MKPKMTFNFRISIDDCHKQRYTENEIRTEIRNDNVVIQRGLLVRKGDGAVLGEILT